MLKTNRELIEDITELITDIKDKKEIDKKYIATLSEVIHVIESSEVAHWEYHPNGAGIDAPAWCCNKCGGRNDMIPMTELSGEYRIIVVNPYKWSGSRYCPHCGRKMESVT